MSALRLSKSEELLARAKRSVPGGVYGHQAPGLLVPGSFPTFLTHASGCRVHDPDGNEYIDFLCAYGPIVAGYANPEIEAAAAGQRKRCDSGNLPAPNMIELAERLVDLTAGMDWAVFAKNGSDVASWALAVARAATGRDLVAMVEYTYHGVHGWCNHVQTGFPEAERANVVTFAWNDLAGLEALFRQHSGRIAAVVLTPFRHEAFHDSILPADGFLAGVRAACDRERSLMVIDDVRAGFRLHMSGSTQLWGVTPDMLFYSKALANGYPLSALLGNNSLRDAARSVFVTGTFFTQAVPIAAALATLEFIEAGDGIAYMDVMGRRFCDGLRDAAASAGVSVHLSGPPAIPFLTFPDDQGSFERSRVFATACAEHGVFLHPAHNWFLSMAHTEADVDAAVEAASEAFAVVRAAFS